MVSSLVAICPDIECDACAAAIRRSLGKLDGVIAVDVEVSEKRVTVEYAPEKATQAQLLARLEQAGFRAE